MEREICLVEFSDRVTFGYENPTARFHVRLRAVNVAGGQQFVHPNPGGSHLRLEIEPDRIAGGGMPTGSRRMVRVRQRLRFCPFQPVTGQLSDFNAGDGGHRLVQRGQLAAFKVAASQRSEPQPLMDPLMGDDLQGVFQLGTVGDDGRIQGDAPGIRHQGRQFGIGFHLRLNPLPGVVIDAGAHQSAFDPLNPLSW